MTISPPDWSLDSISLPEDVESQLSEAYTEAFFSDYSNERQAAIDVLDDGGFTIVGQGTGRMTVEGGGIPEGVVAKVAIKQRGYQDNQEEAYMREDLPSEVRDFTTPILDYGTSHRWIAVEKCESGDAEAAGKIISYLDETGVSYESRELGSANVGYYQGDPCIVDWAMLF